MQFRINSGNVIDVLAFTIIERGITGYNYIHDGAELNSHLYERTVSKSFG